MTQFKEKMKFPAVLVGKFNPPIKNGKAVMEEAKKQYLGLAESNTNSALFYYPVLMAADILLYDAKFVPVGDDQLQHLELTRTLARKFNKKFGNIFTEPEETLTKTPRLMSLDDPEVKMSKLRPAGCLFLDDSPTEIKKKIMSAVTDSGNKVVSNFDKKKGSKFQKMA